MKRLTSLLLALLLLPCFILTVFAFAPTPVSDNEQLLTDSEEADLTRIIQSLQADYGFDTMIVTVSSFNGKSAQSYADDYYDTMGGGADGVLFLLSLNQREWHISTCGRMQGVLSDRALMEIEDNVIWYLSEGLYYDGLVTFLNMLPMYLEGSSAAEESDDPNVLLSVGIGTIVAGIAVWIMRASMNTKRPQRSAVNYENEGSYHLRTHQDLFLYSNVTKRAKPQDNGGSSTHRSSSGRSHGGRGGKF